MYIVRFVNSKAGTPFKTREEAVAYIEQSLAKMIARDFSGCRAHIYSNGINYFYAVPLGHRLSYDLSQKYAANIWSNEYRSDQRAIETIKRTIQYHYDLIPNEESITGKEFASLYLNYYANKQLLKYRKYYDFIHRQSKDIREKVAKVYRDGKLINFLWTADEFNTGARMGTSPTKYYEPYRKQATRREARGEYRQYLEENDKYDPTVPIF